MALFTLRTASGSSALRSTTPDTLRYYDRSGLPNFQLYVNGTDVVASQLVPIETVRVDESGAAAPGQLSAAIESTSYTPSALAEVWMEDNVAGRRIFGGYVLARSGSQQYGSRRQTVITVSGYDAALDRIVIPYLYLTPAVAGGADDRSMLQYIINTYGRGLTAPDSTVALTKSTLPTQEFIDATLRDAIEQIVTAATTTATPYYFIDAQARLNYGLTGAAAPYVVSDRAGTPSGSVGYEDIQLDWDDSPVFDYVWVSGGTAAGTGWYPSAPPASGLAFAGVLRQSLSTSAGELAYYGAAFLAKQTSQLRGQITITGYDGFQPGQTLTVYNTAYLPSGGTYLIRGVRHEFLVGTGLRRYVIDFGALPKSLSRELAAG